jgi:CheY-like chemotaxis protein
MMQQGDDNRMHVFCQPACFSQLSCTAPQAIRAAGHSLPVLVMTANTSEAACEACLAAGVDRFLAKPLSMDRLAEAIASMSAARDN